MTLTAKANVTDFRTIPVEVLRDFVRTRAEQTSIRQLALDTGLARTTLHSFANADTTPHPRIRRKIALYYLEWQEAVPDMDLVRPYAAALEVLIDEMPERDLDGAVEIILDGLELGYSGDGGSPPRWLEVLRFVTRRRLARR